MLNVMAGVSVGSQKETGSATGGPGRQDQSELYKGEGPSLELPALRLQPTHLNPRPPHMSSFCRSCPVGLSWVRRVTMAHSRVTSW